MLNLIFKSDSNQNEIFKKSFYVFIIRVLGYFCGFLFFWIVANKYGSKIQGIFSLAFLFLSVGAMLAKLGIETALVKWIASSSSINSEKFIFYKSTLVVIVSSSIIAMIIYFLAPFISLMYNKPDIENSIKYAALSIPFLALLEVSSNLYKGRKKTTIYGIYYHFGKFLFPLVCIILFFILNIINNDTPIISYLLGLIILTIILISIIGISFKGIDKQIDSKFTVKHMLSTSYPMLISSSIIMIMGWSDVFILGFFVSEEKIGVYSTAIKLGTIVSFAYNAIATIAAPKIASYFSQNNISKLKETVSFSSKLMLLTGTPVFLFLFIFPDFFLGLFGEEYLSGKNVLRILLVAQFTNVLTGPVGPILNMTNKQNKLKQFILISLVFNIIISLVLVKIYDVEGVAIASAIGMILWNVLGALYLFKNMGIKTWFSINKIDSE